VASEEDVEIDAITDVGNGNMLELLSEAGEPYLINKELFESNIGEADTVSLPCAVLVTHVNEDIKTIKKQ
jgi:hypothetical protein